MSLNIIISLAGKSQRFFDEGFTQPKYYLPMSDGKTMIEHSIDTLNLKGQYIFIVQREHSIKYNIDTFLKTKYPSSIIKYLEEYTQGASESCYLGAKDLIDNDNPLIISNCDQSLEWDSTDFIKKMSEDVDGCILTFFANTNKNSYAMTAKDSPSVLVIAEKQVISPHSLVGVHYWKRGSDFCRSAENLFQNNIRANNEYYISISYNYLIQIGKLIHIVPMKDTDIYWSVGTPEQYYSYLQKKFGSIKKNNLNSMTRGWCIGDFEPSILRTNQFEVGYLKHHKGQEWAPHVHNEATEYNILIHGKMKVNNEFIEKGDIFIVPKGMLTVAKFLEDCELVCIKTPSIPTDKFNF